MLKEKCHIVVLKETYHIVEVAEIIESKRFELVISVGLIGKFSIISCKPRKS